MCRREDQTEQLLHTKLSDWTWVMLNLLVHRQISDSTPPPHPRIKRKIEITGVSDGRDGEMTQRRDRSQECVLCSRLLGFRF